MNLQLLTNQSKYTTQWCTIMIHSYQHWEFQIKLPMGVIFLGPKIKLKARCTDESNKSPQTMLLHRCLVGAQCLIEFLCRLLPPTSSDMPLLSLKILRASQQWKSATFPKGRLPTQTLTHQHTNFITNFSGTNTC